MCIIVYKPKNIKMPSLETLKNCFESNRHGFGIAVRNSNNKIQFKKGFMNIQDLEKVYEEIKNYTKQEVCLHFRLVSAGQMTPEQTHPFPINDENALEGETDSVIFHNGTIPELSDFKDKSKSDTQRLSEILKGIPEEKISIILKLIGYNKFVFMGQHGTKLIGDFIEDKGIFYSNTGYTRSIYSYYNYPYNYSYNYHGSYNDYDYDDFDYNYQAYNNKKQNEEKKKESIKKPSYIDDVLYNQIKEEIISFENIVHDDI